MKLGLAGTNIPKELLDKLSSEEELEKIIENIETIENLLVLNNHRHYVEDNDDDDELNENY
ncbi:unnamed protein product, partial [Brachionus calyciflorus]